MNITPARIIQRKRDGDILTSDEISDFIGGVVRGEITDYQVTALLMATYFQGMNSEETVALTQAMLASGDRFDLSAVPGPKVDKHSTGGVGDKVSLILAPLAAACGLKVPMMSGRGLGYTGGTLDKLEAIPGFRVNLQREEFERILTRVGCAMIGQTDRVAPADKKLYALRDVTATIECIPLITASILSKKLAEGAEHLVLDVKVGSGAFMKSRESARKLAKFVVQVAKKLKLNCRAVLTSMEQPLGYAVGNALEVRECIEILRNDRRAETASADLRELTLHLCAHMLELAKVVRSVPEGRKLAQKKLADGTAWNVFVDLVREQGGQIASVTQSDRLPLAPIQVQWKARKRGYITRMDAEEIGRLLVELGGGRKRASDSIDAGVGFAFHRKLGAQVRVGDPIVTVYSRTDLRLVELEARFQNAIEIKGSRKSVPRLILEQIG